MNIFYGFQDLGKPKKSKKNYYEYPELTKEERERWEVNKSTPKKPEYSFKKDIIETGRCLSQIIVALLLMAVIVLLIHYCT